LDFSSTGISASLNTFDKFEIGRNQDGSVPEFNGYISDFRYVKGTAVYTANFTPPTAPLTAISGTQLLLKGTDGGIVDRSGRNVIETVGYTTAEPGRRQPEIRTQVKKYGSSSIFFGGGSALDALFVPTNPALAFESGNFTVEFWVNFTSIANRQDLVWWVPDNDSLRGGISWRLSGDALIYYDAAVGGAINTAWLPTINTWYHIALSRSGSSTRLFIDGVAGTTYSTILPYAASYRLYIGKDSASDSYPFTGYMDDFRITKGAARYTTNFTPPTASFNVVGSTVRSMQYLVVGAGGGGGHYGGGGGGGGVQADTVSAVTGVTYTVTVGTGGAGGPSAGAAGSNGNASSITGGGFGIQGVGGQGGGGINVAPPGGSIAMTGGKSGAPQSYAGGASVINSPSGTYRSGGGGGAGGVGIAASASVKPDGGAGYASSITGTSTQYGGGGGGGATEANSGTQWGQGSPSTLNIGGGGAGGGNGHPSPDPYGASGAPGIENLGGGGGGGFDAAGGAGGKGVAIIKIADSITATVTGSPALVTSGGYKVYTFNSTGTIILS
jgi:hypothetical protein